MPQPEAVLQKMGAAVQEQAMKQLSSLVGKALPPAAAGLAQNLAQAKGAVDQAKAMASQHRPRCNKRATSNNLPPARPSPPPPA